MVQQCIVHLSWSCWLMFSFTPGGGGVLSFESNNPVRSCNKKRVNTWLVACHKQFRNSLTSKHFASHHIMKIRLVIIWVSVNIFYSVLVGLVLQHQLHKETKILMDYKNFRPSVIKLKCIENHMLAYDSIVCPIPTGATVRRSSVDRPPHRVTLPQLTGFFFFF